MAESDDPSSNPPHGPFRQVLGFYLKWDNEAAPAAVTKWNVRVLDISKNKRHLDRTAALRFWSLLDEHVKTRHPALSRT